MKIAYISSPPPSRVWFETEIGWTSREWQSGEKDEYCRKVLGWTSANNPTPSDAEAE